MAGTPTTPRLIAPLALGALLVAGHSAARRARLDRAAAPPSPSPQPQPAREEISDEALAERIIRLAEQLAAAEAR